MALTPMRPNQGEYALSATTTNLCATPVTAFVVIPTAGYVSRVGVAPDGTTTSTITTTVKVNGGSDIANGALTLAAASNARNGTVVELPLVGTAAGDTVFVNEGDIVEFASTGGTVNATGGAYFIAIRSV